MTNIWRLAFMFDAHNDDIPELEEGLRRSADSITRIAGDAHVRIGIADTHPDVVASREETSWRTVDGAVEISVAASRVSDLPNITAHLSEPIKKLALGSTIEVMTGPVFSIVPVREGDAFLSLAFKRYDETTSEQFRNWWLRQHSAIATPILGEGLLAYDQVHVDEHATDSAARAFGVKAVKYDAYDNLTWADRHEFLKSISDHTAMKTVIADEVGHINDASRRNSLMRRIYERNSLSRASPS